MIFKLNKLCELIGAQIPPDAGKIEITGVSAIEDAGPNEITFISNPKYKKYLTTTRAGAVILSKDIETPETLVSLIVDDPYVVFLKVLEAFNNRTVTDSNPGANDSICSYRYIFSYDSI